MAFVTHTTSKYFDLSEFNENPIKVNVNSQNHYFVNGLFHQTNFGLNINKATRSDSQFTNLFDNYETTYIASSLASDNSIQRLLDDSPYISVEFKLSNESKIIDRSVFTIVQALANTGGIIGIVFGFFSIIIGPLQEFFFF